MQNTPIFEENGPENFKGIDIMRAVRSFDPCLPCGVHMYTGKGRVQKVVHTPDRAVLRRSDWPATDGGRGPRPSELLERVQELTTRSSDRRTATRPAQRPRSWSAPMIELYGEGLERIFEAVDAAGEAGAAIRAGSPTTGSSPA